MEVKTLKYFGLFASGREINSLKKEEAEKLIYFECKFDTDLFLLCFKIRLYED